MGNYAKSVQASGRLAVARQSFRNYKIMFYKSQH